MRTRAIISLLPKLPCEIRNTVTSLHDEGDDCALKAAVVFMPVSGTCQVTRQGRKRAVAAQQPDALAGIAPLRLPSEIQHALGRPDFELLQSRHGRAAADECGTSCCCIQHKRHGMAELQKSERDGAAG